MEYEEEQLKTDKGKSVHNARTRIKNKSLANEPNKFSSRFEKSDCNNESNLIRFVFNF